MANESKQRYILVVLTDAVGEEQDEAQLHIEAKLLSEKIPAAAYYLPERVGEPALEVALDLTRGLDLTRDLDEKEA